MLSKVVYNKTKGMYTLLANVYIPAFTQISDYIGKTESLDRQARIQKSIVTHSNGKFHGTEYIIENLTILDEDDDPTIIVPVFISGKKAGQIKPKYKTNALFANEPNNNEVVNAVMAQNYDKKTVTLLSVKDIEQNEEILICYGNTFDRSFRHDNEVKVYTTICMNSNIYNEYWFYIYLGAIIQIPHRVSQYDIPYVVRKSEIYHITYVWEKKQWEENIEKIEHDEEHACEDGRNDEDSVIMHALSCALYEFSQSEN